MRSGHTTGKGSRGEQPSFRLPGATWGGCGHVFVWCFSGHLFPLTNTACLSDSQGEEFSIKSRQEEENENLRKGLALDLSE